MQADQQEVHQKSPLDNPPTLFTLKDSTLAVVEFEDQAWLIAKQVGAKLGYSDEGASLIKMIGREWREEFIDGVDCMKLAGPRLAAFKAAIRNHTSITGVVDVRSSHLFLLSISGAQLAAMKREGPEGVAFRKLLRFTIVPEWEAARKAKAAAAPSQLPLPAPAKALPGPAAPPAVDPAKALRRKERAAQVATLLVDHTEDELSRIAASIGRLQRDDGFNLPMEIGILVGNFTADQMRMIKTFLEAALVSKKGTLPRGTRLSLVLRVAAQLLERCDSTFLHEVCCFESRHLTAMQNEK